MKLFIVCCAVLLFSTNMLAQNWNIRLDDGTDMPAVTPTMITSDSLFVRSDDNVSRAVPLSGIKRVTYREKESNAGQGLVIGLLSGAAAGYVIGLIADGNNSPSYPYDRDENQSNLKVVLPVVGGVGGGIVGYAAGAGSGKRTVELSSLTSGEKYVALSKLLPGRSISSTKETVPAPPQHDILYLKNGSVIRGDVVELIPDSTVRVVTADSSVFVVRMSEVDKIVKGTPPVVSVQPKPTPRARSYIQENDDAVSSEVIRPFRFGLNVGVAVPTGEFASTSPPSGGAAKPGLMFGGDAEYRFDQNASFLASISVALNSVDMNTNGTGAEIDPWTTVWPMIGIRFYPQMRSSVEPYMQGKLGILFGSYPGINASSGSTSFSEPSVGASSVAFSFGAGMVFVRKVNIAVSYLYGSPEYELRAVWMENGSSVIQTGKISQSTGIVQVSAGVVF